MSLLPTLLRIFVFHLYHAFRLGEISAQRVGQSDCALMCGRFPCSLGDDPS